MKSIYSPIGKPARKAYSLFPIINEAGRGFDYIDALLKSSFQDGINIGDEEYLEDLVTKLDLDWMEIKKELNTKSWKKVLNVGTANVLDVHPLHPWDPNHTICCPT